VRSLAWIRVRGPDRECSLSGNDWTVRSANHGRGAVALPGAVVEPVRLGHEPGLLVTLGVERLAVGGGVGVALGSFSIRTVNGPEQVRTAKVQDSLWI
jgi:hypothetical protein